MKQKAGSSAAGWGQWIAMAAAVILTAKGEFDLAVAAHFSPWIAWMFPVMLDIYVIVAFHRRRWADMVTGMLLMLFCQVAVHLLPVFITEGEAVPWGLVMAVACIAPIVVVRVKILAGKTAAEVEAAEEMARRAEELRKARAETTSAIRRLTEIQAQVKAEIQTRGAAEEARTDAETRAIAATTLAETRAKELAEIQAETEAEIERARQAEIAADEQARRAEIRAGEQAEAARLAEGRLAEARDAADRATAARVVAEQAAAAQVEQVTAAAAQAEESLRQRLAAATEEGRVARQNADESASRGRVLHAQLDDARDRIEQLVTERAAAAQKVRAITEARDAIMAELDRTRAALARAQQSAAREKPLRVRSETGRPADRKSGSAQAENLTAVAASFPAEILPTVESVRPETVAHVLAGVVEIQTGVIGEIAKATNLSGKTVGKVVRVVRNLPPENLPAELRDRLAPVLAISGSVSSSDDLPETA
ncbi:hypothetical protein [Polymorphospora sp. NPDC050346]|uniref:hypothetical protein n=1 Tax=Polymorphospora sp. NPDC050346 TaxID=3155780 RepID=UPI003408E4AB